MDSSGELSCVGKLEIAKPKPAGFLCGTLPVLADASADAAFSVSRSALVPSGETIKAPRYQMLPNETDLNTLPNLPNVPEKVLPVDCKSGDFHWESGPVSQNISKKCEALAVTGLADYGEEIDVVAPADILKQIFKIPYSKARLSIAVHRIGDTLILNTGPDAEEGENTTRRQNSQPRGSDSSIFLNFAMHSVRAEACDCPPSHYASADSRSSSTVLPGHYGQRDATFVSSAAPPNSDDSRSIDRSGNNNQKDIFSDCVDYPQKNQDKLFWGRKKKPNTKGGSTVNRNSQVGEKPRGPMQESEKSQRNSSGDFLRVLFWQFHNFRMLLGSDLLLFSNEKYVSVSLHLWDIARQVTPLSWLEAWLDNVMASVPELAICYHQNGVVQGYELLKTDDIFLLKGISEDGTPAFNPQVVQQNGLSVLRFLQDNCKQDPGAYWLYKNAGEDVIQLFDLSVLPTKSSTNEHNLNCKFLPSLMHKERRDSLFSLGTLLYRVAHRLSLSKAPDRKAKCVKFFRKCLAFVQEHDHLVVRAYAHEQFARLILRCYEELDFTSESFLLDYEAAVTGVDEESSEFSPGMFSSKGKDRDHNMINKHTPSSEDYEIFQSQLAVPPEVTNPPDVPLNSRNITSTETLTETTDMGQSNEPIADPVMEDRLAVCQISKSSVPFQTVADPISSKLAAIHHVSQAIKSLRWSRQLQIRKADLPEDGSSGTQRKSSHSSLSLCACGDVDCIEVCDIREWLMKAKMDNKLWKLVLLLGESYLALGEVYKEDGQLHRALKIVEIACSVYGSMPQHVENAQFISSMVSSSSQLKFDRGSFSSDGEENTDFTNLSDPFFLFWAKAWALVGDLFVEYHRLSGKNVVVHEGRKYGNELRMSSEVVKEVTRLKKKLGRYSQNCSTCSLLNCSCQNDRASSGYSASSSTGHTHTSVHGRKGSRKSQSKYSSYLHFSPLKDDTISAKSENAKGFESGELHYIGEIGEQAHVLEPGNNIVKSSSSSQTESTAEVQKVDLAAVASSHAVKDSSKRKHGGIFEYLEGPRTENVEYNLSAALGCFDMAVKSYARCFDGASEVQSVMKKIGWVCNELGRIRLNNGDLRNAEVAFRDAINAFREVSDHTNIILINCNMAHGRRALAEDLVSKMENLKSDLLRKNFKQLVKKAKSEYLESLKYYEDAKLELHAVGDGVDLQLRNQVYTQYGNTYLRLGMLLAKENNSEEKHDNGQHEKVVMGNVHLAHGKDNGTQNDNVSASDAFREALAAYESLGEARKQEAAFVYFHLACYHKVSCLKILDLDTKQAKTSKCDGNNRQKAKWYASLAERNWQKAKDFYGPKSHMSMFINILLEQSILCSSLSTSMNSCMMLESALSHLLEGRRVTGEASDDTFCSLDPEIHKRFWNQLQSVLKKSLAVARSSSSNKSGNGSEAAATNRMGDFRKLREMYRMSLTSNDLRQLDAVYKLWIS